MLNQLLSGHALLNSHRAKINRTVSESCDTCQIKEYTEHYLYHCDKYQTERNKLEKRHTTSRGLERKTRYQPDGNDRSS